MLRCRVAAPSHVRKWRSAAIPAERSASVTASSESPASSARQARVLWTQHVVSAARRAVGSSASTRRRASLAASALRAGSPSSQRTIESVEARDDARVLGEAGDRLEAEVLGRALELVPRPREVAEVQVAVAGHEGRLEAEARVLLLLGDAYEPLDQAVVEAVLAEDEPVRRRPPQRREDRRRVPEALAELDRALEGRARVGRGVALERRERRCRARAGRRAPASCARAFREIVERGQARRKRVIASVLAPVPAATRPASSQQRAACSGSPPAS